MRTVKVVTALVCGLLLIVNCAAAAPAKSLGDLNKVARYSSPPFFTQSGNKIFFFRSTEALGGELWVTDGTVAGTELVKDIVPGSEGSNPIAFAPATFGGEPGVYFIANTPAEGTELWMSDGTEAGTQIVKDIYPGNSDGLSTGGVIGFASIITSPAASSSLSTSIVICFKLYRFQSSPKPRCPPASGPSTII